MKRINVLLSDEAERCLDLFQMEEKQTVDESINTIIIEYRKLSKKGEKIK